MQPIRWNQHSAHLTHSVSELYRNSDLTDCILDVEDKSIHVHKIILAACSPYFKNLLKFDTGITLLPIKDVTYKDMKLILDFIYYGEADVHITDVTSLVKTAELLEMTSLKHCVYHCFQKELSSKGANAKSMDDGVPCTNLIRHETKNLLEEQDPHDGAVLHSQQHRFSFADQNIHLHSICDPSTKCVNNFQDVSGKWNKDQSKSSAPNLCDSIKDNTGQKKDNVNDELSPFTFVVVPETKDPDEGHLDDRMCFDSILKDPLGESSGILDVSEERSVKKECTFDSEQLVKKELKDDNDVSESMSEDVLMSDKLIHSLHQLSSTKCNLLELCNPLHQESAMDRNPYVMLSDAVGSEGSDSGKPLDLEIKFESICEISEAKVKDENVFETGQCLNPVLGDNTGTALVEPKSELLNSVQHISSIDYEEEMNEEGCVASTNKISTPNALEMGNITPAKYETPSPSSPSTIFCEEGRKLKKKSKASDCSLYDNESLISKKEIDFQPLMLIDPLHQQLKPQFRNRDDHFGPVQTHCTKIVHFPCNICCKSFREVSHLRIHMRTHTPEKEFAKHLDCPICNKTFGSKYYMGIHMRTHSGQKPMECEICKKVFYMKAKLNRHMRRHTDDRPFECEICKKAFSLKYSLDIHLRIHSGFKPFECEVCKKAFYTNAKLIRHIRTHTGESPFECDICKKAFKLKESLEDHVLIHSGDKRFECEICKMSYSRRRTLIQHMRSHTGDRQFDCEICKKSFSRKQNREKHMRIHSGEKPFQCEICKKSFLDKQYLKVHMGIHSSGYSIECEICKKFIASKYYLEAHMRIHSGDKPFECAICKKSFSMKGNLNQHMRTHTGERRFESEICK